MNSKNILGILLAGGKSRRMGGGDKCLLNLGHKTILQHVIDRAAPQVDRLLLNANGDPNRFQKYNLAISSDSIDDFAGPLAGVLTGLDWAIEHMPSCKWVVTFPTDTPFFPKNLVSRLFDSVSNGRGTLACAASGFRNHPAFGIWPVHLRDALKIALVDEGVRKVDEWTNRYNLNTVAFESSGIDPFFNVNRLEDLQLAESHLKND